jgi:hypothetical protein
MPNEFIIKNGFRSQGNSEITGSVNVTGSVTASGDIVPATNNIWNLGSGTRIFANAFIGSLSWGGTLSSNGGEIRIVQTIFRTGNNVTYQWSQTPDSNGTKDLGLRRNNTGSLEIYNGVTADGTLANRRDLLVRNISSSLVYVTGSSNQTLFEVDSDTLPNILFVSGSGRVGIGTGTPTYRLDVASSTGVSQIGVTSAANSIGEINFINSGYALPKWTIRSAGAPDGSSGNLVFQRLAGTYAMSITEGMNVLIGTTIDSARLTVRGSGATSATTTFLLQNSTPTNLMSVLDNGQTTFSSPIISLATSQSAFSIAPIISASNTIGGQYYGVNITPTFFSTTTSQTETALRVAATFTGSTVATAGTNIIADFGATSAGSQFTVTDVTSGSIYMVNDVSGLPIIEATSAWDVNMYNFPNLVFQKTGTQVNIFGTLRVSGSFILPLSQSATPQTGSAYWSGSLLFVYDGIRYRSSSFA